MTLLGITYVNMIKFQLLLLKKEMIIFYGFAKN